ncbi:MAG: N-6 DNA methylase [Paludibacteraceae bacterium]
MSFLRHSTFLSSLPNWQCTSKTSVNKIYDPACGSGSLLLQAKKHFDNHIIEEGFLWAGSKPHHVQPGPYEYVFTQHQLRQV